jgi:uncharacterized protein
MTYRDRLGTPGPKKLLALDGGGIRGVVSLEVLHRMECMLAEKLGAGEDFVLSHYFDYIAGTSTGAIIAAGLARGHSVAHILDLYTTRGEEMFDHASLRERYHHLYGSQRLRNMLQELLGPDTTLGSDDLKTLLLVIVRNATTDSPWPVSNNPNSLFNDPTRPDDNLAIPLWQLVRASTAAPIYFPPETVTLGEQSYVFVDGGLTLLNNPAFQLFLMATLEPYRLCWPATESELLLVSVGTGNCPKADDRLRPDAMNLLFNASSVPAALMHAALNQQDLLCRVFGRCRHGAPIDSEVGNMMQANGLVDNSLFSYVRYDCELTRRGLDELGLDDLNPEHVQRMNSVEHIDDLIRVGQAAARAVDVDHFTGFLERAQ